MSIVKIMRTVTCLCVAVMVGFLASVAIAASPSEGCDTPTLQSLASKDTTVAFAAREFGGICRVHGYVTTRDPGPNQVLFVLMLPDNFNGRYLYQGVGGAAGALPSISAKLLSSGYAVAASDGGSGAKNSADFSFNADPAKRLDFAWRGVHVSAEATQHITRRYYGRDTIFRYAKGCSGGGHMAMENALRFGGNDFDGFIVGATPFPDTMFAPNVYRIAQYLQTHPEGWISPALMRAADAAILERYDETDGVRDGIIADTRNIKNFDQAILSGVGFSPAQINTFNTIRLSQTFAVPGSPDKHVQPGYPIANVAGWSRFLLGWGQPPWPSVATTDSSQILRMGAPYFHVMADTMVRARNAELYYADIADPLELTGLALKESEGATHEWDRFASSDAKMIFYHGVNDEANSYLETLQSYEKVAAAYKRSNTWFKYFPVPGLAHCTGGTGPTAIEDNLLEAMVAWVEKSEAPESVVATRQTPQNGVERTFLICAEPKRARLNAGELDPSKAESWTCKNEGKGE